MRLRTLGVGLTMGAAALATAVIAGPNAYASHGGGGGGGRPCGLAVTGTGNGTLGSPWTDKTMYDDDGAVPGVVVGEEFEINTPAGQQWSVQLADNGLVFFNKVVVADAAGIKAMSQTPDQNRTDQVMTATAVNLGNGEKVNAQLLLPGPPPPTCGEGH